MRLAGTLPGQLTYCTNIHAGETWPEVLVQLERHLPAIKQQIAPDQPFGVGLRLSALAAGALGEPAARARFQDFLEASGCYVFTLNGFPYGPFHGVPVKQAVYQPDWQHAERLAYTNQLADLLAEWLPEDPALIGSISTVPGTFKPLAEAPGVVEEIARNLIRCAAHLVGLRQRTGRTIALALEPEPYCFLETIAETVAFFEQHLLSDAAISALAAHTGLQRSAAEAALRRHLGVCYDVCHAAVEFEDPDASLGALRAAGISVPKLQLSAALRLPVVDPGALEQLRPFDEPVYLHQVVERRGEALTRYLDLSDAFQAFRPEAPAAEWRVHFHVPIFLAELEHFATTQDFLAAILARHRAHPIAPHLEVETYTWDVLPERYRQVDVATAIARELAWVRMQLGA